MPTINKRFLLKLLLVLLVSTGALFGVHAVQARRIPTALKLQSERAAEDGKVDIAIHYLRQYLEFYPEDVESQVQLAELLTKRPPTSRGQWELLFLYDKVLRLDPDRDAIRRNALTISLRLSRFNDAVTHAEYLLKSSPTEAKLWLQLGAAQTGLNEVQAARRSFEDAVKHAPQEMIGYQRLAQLVWRQMSDVAGARDVLNRMVRAVPQEPDAYLIRARFELLTTEDPGLQTGSGGDLSLARLDLLRVFELDPEHAEASLLLAEVMQRNKNVPAAHALLRDAATVHPRNLKIVRALSWLELIRGNPAAAITVLEDGLKVIPEGFDLMVPLADLLVQQGDTVRTAEILRRLQERRAPSTQVKYLQARFAMREHRWQDAIAKIESLRSEIVNMPGLETQLNLLLGSCFQKLGDSTAEENAYLRVVNADAKHVIARVGLGNLYMNLGRFDDAARELDLAVQSPYATGVVVAQWAKLKTRQLQNKNSHSEWQKLDQSLTKFAPRFGRGSSEPVILRAEVFAAQGRAEDAVKLLRKEASLRPGDPRIWSSLALMTADTHGTAAGLTVMDEAQALVGDCVDVRLTRATLYSREPGRVRPIDSLGERIEAWPESEQIRMLAGLVEVYDQLGDRPSVVRTLRRIVARQPQNASMWLKLHERATPGDEHAIAARAALVKIEGENSPSVLLCDARAADPITGQGQLPRLEQAFGANPTRGDACLAMYRFKYGTDVTAATALLERAFHLEPTRYETAEALLTHFASRREPEAMRQMLARLAADPRWAGEPFRRVVSHVISVVPNVAAELLNLARPHVELQLQGPGWLGECAVKHNLPEAVKWLDNATNRPTATSDDWLRKALNESKENPNLGPLVLDEAKGKLTPAIFFALVAVYAESAAGSTFVPESRAPTPQEKRLLAQSRLAVKLSRSQSAEAGKVLEAFLAEKEITPADADWARRNLSMIYAVGGTHDDRVRAMTLLKDVKSDDATQEELRATVSAMTVLARYLEGPDRRAVLGRAITALEAIHTSSNAPKDLFSLAQLYRAAGNRRESRKCLQKLLSRNSQELKNDPSYSFYLTAALEELVEDGNFEAANKFAEELMGQRPNDYQSLSAIARYEVKAGRPERGLGIAEDYARLADSSATDYIIRSAQVAELMDELSRMANIRGTTAGRRMTNAAADRYAAIVPTRPEAIVGVAGVLSADGRAAEAFERIERLNRYIPARIRASAGLAIVRCGTVTDQEANQVQQWLDACLTEEPDSIPLLLSKGEFFTFRRDIASASAMYEKVLTKEPRNVVALNNLAWLLAADPKTAEKALELITRATRERGLTGDLLDTRARVRITLKRFNEAESDLAEAITHDPTALRWFHVAVMRMNQTPPAAAESKKAFEEAKRRGLTDKIVHPTDVPAFRLLETK